MFYTGESQRTFSSFTISCYKPKFAILVLLDDHLQEGRSEPFSLAEYGQLACAPSYLVFFWCSEKWLICVLLSAWQRSQLCLEVKHGTVKMEDEVGPKVSQLREEKHTRSTIITQSHLPSTLVNPKRHSPKRLLQHLHVWIMPWPSS